MHMLHIYYTEKAPPRSGEAGRVPAPGEFVDHPAGWRFEVIDGDPRMVKRLRIQPLAV